MKNRSLSVILLLTFLGSCGLILNELPSGRGANEKELTSYSKRLEKRFKEFPNDVFNDQIDVDYLFERIYEAGLPKSLTDVSIKKNLSDNIYQLTYRMGLQMKEGYSDFLQLDVENSEILYRLYDSEGLNYFRFYVVYDRLERQAKIGDIYVFSSGEYLSQTLARIFMSSMVSSNLLNKEYAEEKTEALVQLNKARGLMASGDYLLAKKTLDSSWVNFDDKKTWHLINIQCSLMIDSATYVRAVEDFASNFSDDPSWLIQGIDYYYTIEDWDKAKGLVAQLREQVGDDAILDSFEADIEWSMGNTRRGLELINKAIKKMPEFDGFYYSKFVLEGQQGNFEAVYQTLKILYDKFDVPVEDMDFNLFPDFKQTKYYRDIVTYQQL